MKRLIGMFCACVIKMIEFFLISFFLLLFWSLRSCWHIYIYFAPLGRQDSLCPSLMRWSFHRLFVDCWYRCEVLSQISLWPGHRAHAPSKSRVLSPWSIFDTSVINSGKRTCPSRAMIFFTVYVKSCPLSKAKLTVFLNIMKFFTLNLEMTDWKTANKLTIKTTIQLRLVSVACQRSMDIVSLKTECKYSLQNTQKLPYYLFNLHNTYLKMKNVFS